MPLPKPPGYRPRRQLRVDRRRVVLAALVLMLLAAVLLVLLQRAALAPGTPIRPLPPRYVVAIVLMAGFCGAWGESMRQISLTRRGRSGMEPPPGG
ncbi:hypothetical protein [Cyanobium sp. NIES-981]|uniref:hypothetical protein n=1 Tax=Cyanobium sp. NIES-981 TaxID=1851505 RepID=UPI0007DD1428|nr:hypothetical protein [Cyanobium sp. NIES-981]SBO44749.1 Uncharacterized membrane protein [Cyanobium sp. NIES-981]